MALRAFSLQADGKLVFGGASSDGQSAYVGRLHPDGTLEDSSTFNSLVSGTLPAGAKIDSVALQADGKILIGGTFTTVGGLPRNDIARLLNDPASQSLTVPDLSRVYWERADAAPEVEQVTFELSSNNGSSWTSLGAVTRVAGGWLRSGLSLPASGRIRARGRTAGGKHNSSSGIVESIAQFPSGPEISVVQPSGAILSDAGAMSFVATGAGASTTMNLTVKNHGDADLTDLGITIDGVDAADFSVSANPTAPVCPGCSTAFTVRFAPSAVGSKSAALHISSNDSDENPFDIMLSGNGIVLDLAIEQPAGNELADDAAAVDFGLRNVGYSAAVKTFTVRNTGTGLITGLTLSKDGAHSGDFSVSQLGVTSLAEAAAANFTVTFVPSATGLRTAALHLASNDPDENPFDLTLTGTGTMPKISVEQPEGSALTDGSATPLDFGIIVAGSSVSRTFTIRNLGSSEVTGLAVTKAQNGNPGDFSVDVPAAAALAAGDTTTFTVTFFPTALGVRTATLRIASNGGDETPFTINLTGTQVTPNEAWRQA